jgi:AcrR family transcriptional regulator
LARPRSGDKQKAILDAALWICAERGIGGAPTSAISKAAGIAEGSLFTYFKTKDDLLNELYLSLRREFSRHMPDFPHGKDPRTRLKYVWNKYLELGKAHPEQLKVLAQLRASGKLFKENEPPNFALVEVMKATSQAAEGGELSKLPPEYLVLMVRAQAEITVEFINAHPESAEICRELGFNMLWNGLSGK